MKFVDIDETQDIFYCTSSKLLVPIRTYFEHFEKRGKNQQNYYNTTGK